MSDNDRPKNEPERGAPPGGKPSGARPLSKTEERIVAILLILGLLALVDGFVEDPVCTLAMLLGSKSCSSSPPP